MSSAAWSARVVPDERLAALHPELRRAVVVVHARHPGVGDGHVVPAVRLPRAKGDRVAVVANLDRLAVAIAVVLALDGLPDLDPLVVGRRAVLVHVDATNRVMGVTIVLVPRAVVRGDRKPRAVGRHRHPLAKLGIRALVGSAHVPLVLDFEAALHEANAVLDVHLHVRIVDPRVLRRVPNLAVRIGDGEDRRVLVPGEVPAKVDAADDILHVMWRRRLERARVLREDGRRRRGATRAASDSTAAPAAPAAAAAARGARPCSSAARRSDLAGIVPGALVRLGRIDTLSSVPSSVRTHPYCQSSYNSPGRTPRTPESRPGAACSRRPRPGPRAAAVRLAVPVRPVVRRDADPRPVARHGDPPVAKVGVVLVVVDAQVLTNLRPVRLVPLIDATVPLVTVVRAAPVPRRQEHCVAVGAHRPILAHPVVGVAPVHRVAELRPPALAGLARAVGHPLEPCRRPSWCACA